MEASGTTWRSYFARFHFLMGLFFSDVLYCLKKLGQDLLCIYREPSSTFRAITNRCISLVPSPIVISLAALYILSTGYSRL